MKSKKSYLRRRAMLAGGASSLLPNTALSATKEIIAGAIRWDAWYLRQDYSIKAQENLDAEPFQGRAPLHCRVTGEEHVFCVGSQAIMDQEIIAAHEARLKFWAFVWYDLNSSLSAAWKFYQTSLSSRPINWCGIVTLDHLGSIPFSNDLWKGRMNQWLSYMQQATYQTIQGDDGRQRPILFILWQDPAFKNYFSASFENFRSSLEYLNARLKAVGRGAAYVVVLDGVAGAGFLKTGGFDAVSSYMSSLQRPETTVPYVDLDVQTRKYWRELAATGSPIVPIGMIGWDTRPRRVSGASNSGQTDTQEMQKYYLLPTAAEFQTHIRAAVNFIRSNPGVCPSRVLLIYAWDECDEGGGILPTLSDKTGKYIQALGAALG